jgi:ribonucleoside-diphosphate reductase alpha chain
MNISDKELDAVPEYGKLVHIETECGPVYLKKIKAKSLFMRLAENNWDYAEPGILYCDRISNWNMMANDPDFEYAGVNPCAEEPLPLGGACLLGSLNLSEFVKNGKFDEQDFRKSVRIATKALDDIQKEGRDLNPLAIQKETAKKYRQIGLGIMGISDMLIKLGLKYDSDEGIEFCDKIGKMLFQESYKMSCELGEKYGEVFDNARESDITKYNFDGKIPEKAPHNSQILTIAPTGTLSTFLNISGGTEPTFALEYTRTTKSLHGKDVTYKVYPKIVQDYFNEHPELENDISKLPDYFVGAEQIDWHQRIKMQATWQKHIDASISSTINLPKETTVQEVYDIYMEAWKAGLKGVTIFRSNCARIAILNTGSNPSVDETEFKTTTAPKRPKDLEADFYRIKAGGDNFLIFVGLMNNRPYEVFAMPASDITDIPQTSHGKITRKKKRQYTFLSDDSSLYWDNISLDPEDYKEWRATTLHVSAMLRHGMPIQSIMKIEDKCNGVITSFNKAIWKVLAKYVPAEDTEELCPQCGTGHIIRENGCEHCDSCGWSRCN